MNLNDNYKQRKLDIRKHLDKQEVYSNRFIKDNNNQYIIEMYDTNNQLKLRALYTIIGMYNNTSSIWYWGWNLSYVNKQLINHTTKIQEFSKTIKDNYKQYKPQEAEELHYLTSNGNFYLSNKKLPYLLKLALYLLNGIWIVTSKLNTDITQYILIDRILQTR